MHPCSLTDEDIEPLLHEKEKLWKLLHGDASINKLSDDDVKAYFKTIRNFNRRVFEPTAAECERHFLPAPEDSLGEGDYGQVVHKKFAINPDDPSLLKHVAMKLFNSLKDCTKEWASHASVERDCKSLGIPCPALTLHDVSLFVEKEEVLDATGKKP